METAWLGRSNTVRRDLTKDGADLTAPEKAAVTKVQVTLAGLSVNSVDNANIISYSDGVVSIKFGLISGLSAGTYLVFLDVFDGSPEPDIWGEFLVEVLRAGGAP